MKTNFVADGRERLLRGQKNLSQKTIQKTHADELMKNPDVQKPKDQQEILRHQNHKPSVKTLW